LRDAVAEAVAPTSSEVPLLECSASIDPKPFAVAVPLLVAAFTPPAPLRLAAEAGFCAVTEAAEAALELRFGLAACASAAVLAAALVAVLLAVVLTLLVVLEAADFDSAAADSVEPAKLPVAAFPVLDTLPAV
jgi:hypothetical protein